MRLRHNKIQPAATTHHLMIVLASEVRPGDQVDHVDLGDLVLEWVTVTDLITNPTKCPAAHAEDNSLCDGPAGAVRIIDLAGRETTGCVLHGAVLLASLDDGYVYPGPDARDGDAIAVYKLANTLKPFAFNTTVTVRFNRPGQPQHTWLRDEPVEVWRKEHPDLVYRLVHSGPDLDQPYSRKASIEKFTKAAAEREFAKLATPTRFHPGSGRRLAVMSLPECERLQVNA